MVTEVKKSLIKLSSEKTLTVKALDGKKLYIDTSSVAFLDIQRDRKEGYIISISLEGKHTISLGDKFLMHVGAVDSIYEVKYMIVEKGDKSILLFSSVPNKTSTFLLPLLGKNKSQLQFDTYFINAFIDKEMQNISLLYRFTGTAYYKTFEQKLMSDPLFITHGEYDPYHVMYTFRIPKEFISDVTYFIEGKYSQFSETLRKRIMKFYGSQDGSAIMQIIKKDKRLKEKMEEELGVILTSNAELASKPNLELEIYNIK